MKLPNIYFITYSIFDLPEVIALQKPNSITELRQKVNILIIDDEDFIGESYLRKNGFNITHKADIDTIKDVASYSVILCDIRGVGKQLGSSKEGAFIIKEIKANYPNKQVVAYTGSSYDEAYNEYMKQADAVISKGTSIDDWISILDTQIKKAVDPKFQWEKLRRFLLESGVSTASVASLEDKYVRAVKKKDFSGMLTSIDKTDKKAQEIISEFVSSVCVKLILGSI